MCVCVCVCVCVHLHLREVYVCVYVRARAHGDYEHGTVCAQRSMHQHSEHCKLGRVLRD